MKAKTLGAKVEVSSDGEGLVSHSGAFLLSELADRIGLTEALSEAMAPTRVRRSAHDPGVVLRDLVVAIADGGDCVSDLGVLRGQLDLFGAVASESTAHRVIGSIDSDCLERIQAARAKARAAAWAAGAKPEQIVIDIDATLLEAHSEKESAAGNYKGGFGFHPLLAYLDETGEALAGLLRPGNAGANTAADHFTVLAGALEQIPRSELDSEILARADGGGATHAFTADCRSADIRFSVGYELTASVREAILSLPESRWQAAIEASGELREGAWVSELTDLVSLADWPERTRLICRRERAHPGAQLSFDDGEGHRFTCFLTDSEGGDLAALELRHRRRARVEDSIRTGKDTGMRNLPFGAFAANQAWLELSLLAQDLFAWAKALVLDGELALAEPKRLRQRLLHVAGRIVRSGRRKILRLPRGWPWAEPLRAAFERLRSLPAPG
ncbi:MAG: IS1380 family transposase [Thermomicrobiales bacterium]|nr:IS1380 family transposase [Thermomicrobiales bacterium]